MAGCSPKLRLSSSEKTLYPISANQPKDSVIIAYYLPYKMRLDSQMNENIAVSAIEIVKGKPEGPLNNLMADAMYETGRLKNISFDIAYTNYGGLRISLPKGNIPLFKVFELIPFELSTRTGAIPCLPQIIWQTVVTGLRYSLGLPKKENMMLNSVMHWLYILNSKVLPEKY